MTDRQLTETERQAVIARLNEAELELLQILLADKDDRAIRSVTDDLRRVILQLNMPA